MSPALQVPAFQEGAKGGATARPPEPVDRAGIEAQIAERFLCCSEGRGIGRRRRRIGAGAGLALLHGPETADGIASARLAPSDFRIDQDLSAQPAPDHVLGAGRPWQGGADKRDESDGKSGVAGHDGMARGAGQDGTASRQHTPASAPRLSPVAALAPNQATSAPRRFSRPIALESRVYSLPTSELISVEVRSPP